MFKWLKDKFNKKVSSEMNGCITQNLNFVYSLEVKKYVIKENISEDIMSHIYLIKDQTEKIKLTKNPDDDFSPDENDILMKLNKDCRRIWANYLGGSNFKFDQEFPTNEKQFEDFKKLLTTK